MLYTEKSVLHYYFQFLQIRSHMIISLFQLVSQAEQYKLEARVWKNVQIHASKLL